MTYDITVGGKTYKFNTQKNEKKLVSKIIKGDIAKCCAAFFVLIFYTQFI